MRNIVFISHANPEDNGFSLWLSMQLMRHGYDVWCDLIKLPGGETFWHEIEQTIRHKSAKFLYVLSKTSNQKRGPLDELQVALNPAHGTGGVVISFATAEQLGITASRSEPLSTTAALDKADPTIMPIERRELGFAVQRLVRDGWQRFVASRGLGHSFVPQVSGVRSPKPTQTV